MNALGAPPPLCRGGQGDHATSLNLLAAVLAALRLRDRTGHGQSVEVTLQGTGMWTVASDLSAVLLARQQAPRHELADPSSPIWNCYRSRDERWILLVMPAPDPYWPRFCRALGEPAWADDPRYCDMAKRRAASRELAAAIAERFALRDLAEWSTRLDAEGLIWAPVVDFLEVVDDPQPRAMGAFAAIDHPQGGRFETLAAPFMLRDADVRPRGAAPAVGEHGRAVLEEIGLGAEEIQALGRDGVLG
jgi:crotonobetainyl-CoA:carnitine CoA-transferase CaiB-like acyl-CoA transferase